MNARAAAWAELILLGGRGQVAQSVDRFSVHAFWLQPRPRRVRTGGVRSLKRKAMEQRINDSAADGLPRLPRNYAECIEYIRSDYFRHVGQRASLPRMWLYGLRNPAFGFSFWLRLSAHRGWLYPVARLLHRRYAHRYGLQIYPTTRIGFGLYIGHAFGTIVNPTAIIGNNVNLSQFTTIGSNRGQAAVIGDCVYVGPCVCIVEHVRVGAGATIGAGAVVTHDVPPDTTVAGVPARIVKPTGHPEFINRRWPVPGQPA